MLKAFQDEAQNGQDPEIKAFAANAVPTLQQHLTEAQKASGMKMARQMMHKKTMTPDSNT